MVTIRQLFLTTCALASAALSASCKSDSSSPSAVSTVTVAPDPVNVSVGQATQLSATLRNSAGETINGSVGWSVDNGGIASVSGSGSLQGLSPGQTVVRATSAGKTGSATVVVAVSTAAVTIQPDSVDIALGSTYPLSATAFDANGGIVNGRTISWTTSDPNVASVNSTGEVTSHGAGRALITATADGKSGTAVVRVVVTADDFNVQAQWTQAMQSADGSIPMVLGGNGAAVNVTVASSSASSPLTQILLRLTSSAGVVIRAETLTVTIPPNSNPTFAAPTAQFRLLPNELVPGMRWQVVRDPKGLVPDADPSTDVFPRGMAQTLAMVSVPMLKVRFVPIVLTAHNNATGKVNTSNLPEYTRTLESAHPIGAFQASVGPNFTTSQSFGTPPDQGGFASTFWQPILVQLDLARVADPDPTTYWVGVVLPPAGFNRTNNGGIGYVPGNGTASGPGTRTNMVTSLGWASDPAFTRVTVAHELGHNFGRPHAPCGPADNTDPNFPYPGGLIGVPGHDVRGWMAGRASTAVTMPATSFDLMGYCTPGTQNWISDYNYRAVLNFRTFTPAAGGSASHATLEPRTRVVLVSGSISRTSGVTLNPAFSADARPARPERDGPYHIEGLTASGAVVFAHSFAPSVIDHAPDAGHFVFAIPMTAATEATLARIEVRGPAGVARIERPIAAPSLRAPGSFAPQRANGMVSIACEDANARGVLVRNAATGVTLGFAIGSTALVSADPGTRLSVVCSDGVRSVVRGVVAP
jgi:uncharacterized protein YjdB